jgi:signal transduction histidine kinase
MTVLAQQAGTIVALVLEQEQQQRRQRFEERQDIARDLHDGIIQTLYGIALQMGGRRDNPAIPEEARAQLAEEIEQINRVIGEVRQYIEALDQTTPSPRADLPGDLAHVLRAIVPRSVPV